MQRLTWAIQAETKPTSDFLFTQMPYKPQRSGTKRVEQSFHRDCTQSLACALVSGQSVECSYMVVLHALSCTVLKITFQFSESCVTRNMKQHDVCTTHLKTINTHRIDCVRTCVHKYNVLELSRVDSCTRCFHYVFEVTQIKCAPAPLCSANIPVLSTVFWPNRDCSTHLPTQRFALGEKQLFRTQPPSSLVGG